MQFSNVLVAAVLVLGALAAPTSHEPLLFKRSKAKVYRAPSELKNVSTYHSLTRGPGSTGHSFRHLMRRGQGYGVAPTTSGLNAQIWYTEVKFGSQTFLVSLDTGSSDLWLVAKGAKCTNQTDGSLIAQGQPGCTTLGPNWDVANSGCAPVPDINFNIPYAGYQIDIGTFCKIDVTIGGITVKNQQVAAVTQVGFGASNPVSGLLGLAYPALTFAYHGTDPSADVIGVNQAPYDPLFTTMWKRNQIPPVFSMALSRHNPLRGNDGFLAFGGLAPVITVGQWGVTPIETIAIDGGAFYLPTVLPYPQKEWYTLTPDAFLYQSADKITYDPTKWIELPTLDHSTPSTAGLGQYIIDSGTSNIYLPNVTAAAINSYFNPPAIFTGTNADGGSAVPCNAKAPWFAIKIGGVVFPMDKQDMIMSDGAGGCISAIAGTSADNAAFTIGDPFMLNVMVVFDVGAGQLKFRSRGVYV